MPQIQKVWVRWCQHSLNWKLLFIAYKQCITHGAAQLAALVWGWGPGLWGIMVGARDVRAHRPQLLAWCFPLLLQCLLSSFAHLAYEDCSPQKSDPALLEQLLNCLKINVVLLSWQIEKNLRPSPTWYCYLNSLQFICFLHHNLSKYSYASMLVRTTILPRIWRDWHLKYSLHGISGYPTH